MSSLEIRKKSVNTWLHNDSVFGDFIISKFYFNSYFNEFQIVEEGNSRLNKYAIGNITLYDDTDGGTPETFSTITELSLRLEELLYPAFDRTGLTVFPTMEQITNVNVTDIEDGQVLVWDATTNKWINTTVGGLTTPSLSEVLMVGNIIDRDVIVEDGISFFPIPDGGGFNLGNPDEGAVQISPDGSLLARGSANINFCGFEGEEDYSERFLSNNFVYAQRSYVDAIIVNANITAFNNRKYNVVSNATITDPTPTEGMGYPVNVINGVATVGGTAYSVGTKLYRHYHSGSWRTFVYLDKSIIDTLLANKIDYLIKDFTFSSVTGVTTETLVKSYEITAGKIGLNDFLNGFIYSTRTGLSNAYTVTLKANTVNNSSTATTIASIATPSNFTPLTPMKFELTVKSGNIIGAVLDQQGTNYKGQTTGVNVAFNNTSNSVYLFLFVTPTNTGSVVQVESFKLTK